MELNKAIAQSYELNHVLPEEIVEFDSRQTSESPWKDLLSGDDLISIVASRMFHKSQFPVAWRVYYESRQNWETDYRVSP